MIVISQVSNNYSRNLYLYSKLKTFLGPDSYTSQHKLNLLTENRKLLENLKIVLGLNKDRSQNVKMGYHMGVVCMYACLCIKQVG